MCSEIKSVYSFVSGITVPATLPASAPVWAARPAAPAPHPSASAASSASPAGAAPAPTTATPSCRSTASAPTRTPAPTTSTRWDTFYNFSSSVSLTQTSSDICKLRIDFDTLVLAGPQAASSTPAEDDSPFVGKTKYTSFCITFCRERRLYGGQPDRGVAGRTVAARHLRLQHRPAHVRPRLRPVQLHQYRHRHRHDHHHPQVANQGKITKPVKSCFIGQIKLSVTIVFPHWTVVCQITQFACGDLMAPEQDCLQVGTAALLGHTVPHCTAVPHRQLRHGVQLQLGHEQPHGGGHPVPSLPPVLRHLYQVQTTPPVTTG